MIAASLFLCLFALCNSASASKRRLRTGRKLQETCAVFTSATFYDLPSGYFEFDFTSPQTFDQYYFATNASLVVPGDLYSWTFYGSAAAAPPNSATDSSWVLLDTQSNVDFSSANLTFPLTYTASYQYYAFVFAKPFPPMGAVTLVAFCPYNVPVPVPVPPPSPSTSQPTASPVVVPPVPVPVPPGPPPTTPGTIQPTTSPVVVPPVPVPVPPVPSPGTIQPTTSTVAPPGPPPKLPPGPPPTSPGSVQPTSTSTSV